MKRHLIHITFNDQQPLRLHVRVLKKSIRKALSYMKADLPCAVDVTLVNKREMQRINKETRGIDAPTDVLSFPQLDIRPGQPLSEAVEPFSLIDGRVLLGDVVLCYPIALMQAIDEDKPFEWQVALLAVHSILHLLGYDHAEPDEEKEMFGLTDRILSAAGIHDSVLESHQAQAARAARKKALLERQEALRKAVIRLCRPKPSARHHASCRARRTKPGLAGKKKAKNNKREKV